MSLFKNERYYLKIFQIIHLKMISIYKQDLALNNHEGLTYH